MRWSEQPKSRRRWRPRQGRRRQQGRRRREGRERRQRAMSTLLSLATAITVLTVAIAGTLIVVEDAFRDTQRGDGERTVAIQASDRLVAADGPLATRPNVVTEAGLEDLDASDLEGIGAGGRYDIAVAVDGERVAATGDPVGGQVVRRIVLVEDRESITREPAVSAQAGHEATLPVRTESVELTIEPSNGTTVTAARINDRVVLGNESGLAGTHEVATARYETLGLSFEADGELSEGDVAVTYEAHDREKATLAVTVADSTADTPRGERV